MTSDRRRAGRAGILLAALLLAPVAIAQSGDQHDAAAHQWPQWRGPLGSGVAPHADPPVEWDEGRNIRWKVALPGNGHSTPCLWGDRLFVTMAAPYGDALPPKYSGAPGGHDEFPITHGHAFVVMALKRSDGSVLWQREVRRSVPHEGGHYTSSLASASPCTDGKRIYASFGSQGVYCLDWDGKVLWEADFGRMHTLHGHGEGSSPTLHGDTLIVTWDHEGPSHVTALDAATGKERWKAERDSPSSWTSPIVVQDGDQAQVIVSGSQRVTGYALASGEELWRCEGLSVENVVATPVVGHGLVYVGSSYDRNVMFAVRYGGARGDITGTDRVAWTLPRRAPYVPSPLIDGDALYFLSHFGGILNRVDARTGRDAPGAIRLAGMHNVFGSPISAAGRIYIVDRNGTTTVLLNGNAATSLALNHLDARISASPIAAGRELYLRGERHLYCIAKTLEDRETAASVKK